jgi:hypothetical protein
MRALDLYLSTVHLLEQYNMYTCELVALCTSPNGVMGRVINKAYRSLCSLNNHLLPSPASLDSDTCLYQTQAYTHFIHT